MSRPEQLGAVEHRAAVDRRRLRPGLRRPPVHRRRPRRPLRPQGRPPGSASSCSRLGSLFGALADTSGQVIAARAVMGVGAAFVMPSTLSILTNVFPTRERAKAIAIWAGISGSRGRDRPARLRAAARALLVGVGVPRQPADHRRRPRRRGRARAEVEGPAGDTARPRRRGAVDRRAERRSSTPSSKAPATAG